MSVARPAPQTTSTAPQPCPTPTASSATLNISGRSHIADQAPIVFGDGTRFGGPQKCGTGALFPTENTMQNEIQKTIFAPKAHLHSSAKDGPRVPWFSGVRDPDRWSRTSERHSVARPAPQTTSTAPQPCPTPTASSATLNISGRSHTADQAPIIFGDS